MLTASSAKRFQIIAFSKAEEHERALNVWLRNFSQPERFKVRHRWYYQSNPFSVHSFLLLDEDNREVGAAGLAERIFSVNGTSCSFGICSDFAVDPGNRWAGPALQLQKTVMKAAQARFRVLYGFPNEKALPVMMRVGYRVLGPLRCHGLAIRSRYYLERRLSERWVRWVAPAVDAATRAWIGGLNALLGCGLRVEEISRCDERFEELWTKCAKRHAFIARRDAGFLNWRFMQNPSDAFRMFGFFRPGSKALQAYAVMRVRDGHWHMVDFLCEREGRLLTAMVARVLAMALAHGAKSLSVEFLGSPRVKAAFIACGLQSRPSTRRVVYLPVHGTRVSEDIGKCDHWYVTGGDED